MATKPIRIRTYQVQFGDCFLVTVPDGKTTRHLLVDFGSAPGTGGTKERFLRIGKNIKEETGGHLDVLIMTHEHLDHMEGFYAERNILDDMTIDHIWMSLPSDPDYYKKYKNAKILKKIRAQADRLAAELSLRKTALAPSFRALLRNNLSNRDRIDYLREMSKKNHHTRIHYLARGHSLGRKPFRSIKGTVLAPEKDVSIYYGGGGADTLAGLAATLNAAASGGDTEPWSFPGVKRVKEPPNLSRTDWKRLRENIQGGAVEAMRTIDKARNNTSLVFLLEIGNKRLLFPGDAELESWEVMARKSAKYLKPVDFLKVSHHGSHNGTPLDLLDTLLPKNRKSKATVIVSTKDKVYGTVNPVPDSGLLKELGKRCRKLISTQDLTAPWVDVEV